ncbi:GNAT superfamily N-acetyltransferase [Salirhabdus euzebyi]|uniref:GNAT superfamily N-acetyltransferase n=1 Tax=Salirhabdus euzebyi TaxID=394506 RepID=A0A841Q594_9BACI|nr:GNAT family N-acetyltransferase [Salirhabdus euzebyi]MBB6453558.1 GNAT superfamily N-acetyltransferase [Salirhabdus euzebyi]
MIELKSATNEDEDQFLKLVLKLSEFNRQNHKEQNKYDYYELVISEIQRRAKEKFLQRHTQSVFLRLAILDGEAIGYVLAETYNEQAFADNGTGKMGLIDEIFVLEKTRGLGVGKKLMDEAIKWLESKKVKKMKLHAYTWNEKAIQVYEKMGFTPYAISLEKHVRTDH